MVSLISTWMASHQIPSTSDGPSSEATRAVALLVLIAGLLFAAGLSGTSFKKDDQLEEQLEA